MDFAESVELADSLPEGMPPLAVDIDGTLTDESRAIDPRTLPVLRAWPTPVVVATGKAPPYAVGLCDFFGLDPIVVAENGGVVIVEPTDSIHFGGDPDAARAVSETYRTRGHDLGWGEIDLVNRWRETELTVSHDSPLGPLEDVATEHGLVVVDTGFAYHVNSPDVDKGIGLEIATEELDLDPDSFVAVGDSENDRATFELVGDGVAVANAPAAVQESATHATAASYADGFLEAVEWIRDRTHG